MLTRNHPFNFLSKAFYYPSEEIIRHGPRVINLLNKDLDCGIEDVPDIPATEFQAEYVRLFINSAGNTIVPPYASVYRHGAGLLYQQGYDEAVAYYREAGVEPIKGPEPPDHLAHELAFVGYLLETGQVSLLDSFLRRHLMKWFPLFSECLQKANPCNFYHGLNKITGACLNTLIEEVTNEETGIS